MTKEENVDLISELLENFEVKFKTEYDNDVNFKQYTPSDETFIIKEIEDKTQKIKSELLQKVESLKKKLKEKENEFNTIISKSRLTPETAKRFVDFYNNFQQSVREKIFNEEYFKDKLKEEYGNGNGNGNDAKQYNFLNDEFNQIAKTISENMFPKTKKEINEQIEGFNTQIKAINVDDGDHERKREELMEKINTTQKTIEGINININLRNNNDFKFDNKDFNDMILYYNEEVLGAARIVVYVRDEIKGSGGGVNTISNDNCDNSPLNCGGLLVKEVVKEGVKKGQNVPTDAEDYLKRKEKFLMIPPNIKESNSKLYPKIYGPFTNVYENTTTENMYKGGFKPFIKKLQNGKNVLIFGFGFSGSGKTYQLIEEREDNTEDPYNILQLFMNDLKSENNEKTLTNISVNVKELYPKKNSKGEIEIFETIKPIKKNQKNITKNLFDNKIELPTLEEPKNIDNFIQKFMKANEEIEKHRIFNMRITPTPNNPVSSRSHIFYEFELTFSKKNNDKTNSKLVIVDMAGTENTIEIKKTFLGIDELQEDDGTKEIKGINDLGDIKDFAKNAFGLNNFFDVKHQNKITETKLRNTYSNLQNIGLSHIFKYEGSTEEKQQVKQNFLESFKNIYDKLNFINLLLYGKGTKIKIKDKSYLDKIFDKVKYFEKKLLFNENCYEIRNNSQHQYSHFYDENNDIKNFSKENIFIKKKNNRNNPIETFSKKFNNIIKKFIGKENLLSILITKDKNDYDKFSTMLKEINSKNNIKKFLEKCKEKIFEFDNKVNKNQKIDSCKIYFKNNLLLIYIFITEYFFGKDGIEETKKRMENENEDFKKKKKLQEQIENMEKIKKLLRLGFMMNYLNLVIEQGKGIVTTLEHIKYFFMHSSINQNKVFTYNENDLGNYRQLGVKVDGKNPLTNSIKHEYPKNPKQNEITEMRNVGEMKKYKILEILSKYSGAEEKDGTLELRNHKINNIEYVDIPIKQNAVFIMLALIKRGEANANEIKYKSNPENVKKFTSAAQETLELANILKSEPQNLDKAKKEFEEYKNSIIEESKKNTIEYNNITEPILYGGRRKKTKRKERKRKRVAKKKSRKYSRNYLKKQKRNSKK